MLGHENKNARGYTAETVSLRGLMEQTDDTYDTNDTNDTNNTNGTIDTNDMNNTTTNDYSPSKQRIFWLQVYSLCRKNMIQFSRSLVSVIIRAYVIPIVLVAYLACSIFIYSGDNSYGVGNVEPLRNLTDAVGSQKIAYYSIESGGLTDTMKNIMATAFKGIPSSQVHELDNPDDLLSLCRENHQGSSSCYAAVQWNSIDEKNNLYNYTLRASSGLKKVQIKKHSSDVGHFILPLQWAVDKAIGGDRLNVGEGTPSTLEFTSISEHQRVDNYYQDFMGIIQEWFSAAMFLTLIGVVYQLSGEVALERESGMVSLLSVMGVPQLARLLSFHISYSLLYLPSWILVGGIYCGVSFKDSNVAIGIIFHILYGLSLVSYTLFLGNLFPSARLSGLLASGLSIFLALVTTIITVTMGNDYAFSSPVQVYVLSALFPPCNYAYFIATMASWQIDTQGANLVQQAPDTVLCLIAFFAFTVFHMCFFFGLAIWYERIRHYVGSHFRTNNLENPKNTLEIRNLRKVYSGRSWYGRRKDPVVAVDGASLSIVKDQIVSLLGANGSGKTTILEMIAGLQTATAGEISFAEGTKFGICPQNNILWGNLTVQEHVEIWGGLKGGLPRKHLAAAATSLIEKCDLTAKSDTLSSGLSGGQKRKLQLAVMFIGGTEVCLIDEVSSGLDPISRRKIWDILLDHRKDHVQIMTTHFLDEADILSDKIAIISKGVLQADGTSVELKNAQGDGYKIYIDQSSHGQDEVLEIATAKNVIATAKDLESKGINYRVTSPTLEDVFLKFAAKDHDDTSWNELTESSASLARTMNEDIEDSTGLWSQTLTMLLKRIAIFRNNPWPEIVMFCLPIIVAGVCHSFYNDFEVAGCASRANLNAESYYQLEFPNVSWVLGPQASIVASSKGLDSFSTGFSSTEDLTPADFNGNSILSFIENRTTLVNTFSAFHAHYKQNYSTAYPGGIYLQDTPVIAYQLDDYDRGIVTGTVMLNYLDNLLMNGTATLVTGYTAFQRPSSNSLGNMLQFVLYFGLSICAASGFMTLYVTYERLTNVRAMEYSNGLRSLPLWLAYVTFYLIIWIPLSAILYAMIAGAESVVISSGYIFGTFVLFGLTSILCSYVISLFATSQLSAYAITVAYQAVVMLIYLVAILCELTYGRPERIPVTEQIITYTLALLGPSALLMRSLFLGFNLFGLTCNISGDALSDSGSISAFGLPIFYLILQAFVLCLVIIWYESGKYRLKCNLSSQSLWRRLIPFRRRGAKADKSDNEEEVRSSNIGLESVTMEALRIDENSENFMDGLLVSHVNKSFGDYQACSDITFGVENGECFALLGPNGAGKTTVFNMIRGEIAPDSGDAFINGISIATNKSKARSRLGVCPQFDAMDQLTVTQNLQFYGRLRQTKNLNEHVERLMAAVGITRFKKRKANNLSGGNKRKLSLAIALICNPHVLLLDEPSSGMDALAKRIMWKTLAQIAQGRSIVLTTHSMEEADALSNRAGFLAKHLLAVGTSDDLRKLHGHFYHVHIVHDSRVSDSTKQMDYIVGWIKDNFPGSHLDDRPLQGQLRISIPIGEKTTISSLFSFFEENKADLQIQEYSVSPTRLEEVFLDIVGAHNVSEEGY